MAKKVVWYKALLHPFTPIKGTPPLGIASATVATGKAIGTGIKNTWKFAKFSGIGLAGLGLLGMVTNSMRGTASAAGARNFADNAAGGMDSDIPQLLNFTSSASGPAPGYEPEQWRSMELTRRNGMPTGIEAALNPKMSVSDFQDVGTAPFTKQI